MQSKYNDETYSTVYIQGPIWDVGDRSSKHTKNLVNMTILSPIIASSTSPMDAYFDID